MLYLPCVPEPLRKLRGTPRDRVSEVIVAAGPTVVSATLRMHTLARGTGGIRADVTVFL